jgi:ribosomal protein S18 acetylase RimI-like enzyme
MQILRAGFEDIATYVGLAQAAQAWLQSCGLGQYVPAAHDEYADAIRSRVESGSLYVVRRKGESVGFFCLDSSPSAWWPADETPALYLAGIVVARSARGVGVGSHIIEWCSAEAARRHKRFVRLDCHADNARLCQYYEAHGFELRGRIEQRPGYSGCLYQRDVIAPKFVPAREPDGLVQ